MKEIFSILSKLKAKGIYLALDASGANLEAKGNLKSLTPGDAALIKQYKPELIGFLATAGKTTAATPAITPVAIQESYPLSSAQQRLWVLSRFEEATAAYHMHGVYIFEGELDKAALAKAFTTLAERHESLRTVFREDEQGEIRQYIKSNADTGFSVTTYQPVEEKNIAPVLQELLSQPFDLAAGPLIRAGLWPVSTSRWVFACCMHHIISDGWSMGLLINELQSYYTSYAGGTAAALPPLSIQYKDYAVWQQEQLASPAMLDQKTWWQQQFTGTIPILNLPADTPRPAQKTYCGAVITAKLDARLVAALRTYTRQQGATLFMGLLAGVKALLYHYTRQHDIIIGTPVAGREQAGLEEQIGCYVNTLALRNSFDPAQDFNHLLSVVKQNTLNAYRHQAWPFDELVNSLQLKRDLSRSALFDVMLILQNTGDRTVEGRRMGGVTIHRYEGSLPATSKFDLTFNCTERGEEIDIELEYNTDICQPRTAGQLLHHLQQLLSAAVAAPATAVRALHLLTAAEKQEQLNAVAANATAWSTTATINSLFREQAYKYPAQTALLVEDRTFTYEEIQEQVNKLAAYLHGYGNVQPGDHVAIQLARSEWMVIAMLAVMQCSAAYVPVDPAYPQDRISYIIADSGAKMVIDQDCIGHFTKWTVTTTINNKLTGSATTDAAYVIYTSGSTGQPKGVVIEHRNIVGFLDNFSSRFGLKEGMRIAATTNYTFDISVLEIIGGLLHGLPVHLVTSPEPRHLLELITRGTIDVLQLTPSRLNQLLEAGNNSMHFLQPLKVLLVGGEALPGAVYQRLKALPSTRVINVYGPTETTIWSSSLDLAAATSLSIGRSLLHEHIIILNEALQCCPPGVAGEIAIGGAGVGRGYWNRPALSAEKFIPHPWLPNERLYRTGDLGRQLPDGNIAFLGRSDDQVKVSGYRIEPGEIANALQQYPGIDTAVVIAKPNREGDNELIAYFINKDGISTTDLRRFLGHTLPPYMIPAYFVPVEAFPLNSSGKIDRSRLPDPSGLAPASVTIYVAPRNTTEAQLTSIWKEVLNIDKVGIKDNFFELGGHSLKATRLASRINKTFGVQLELKTLFTHITPEEQAMLIDGGTKTEYTGIPPIEQRDLYPLSSAQKRLFFLQEFAPDSTGYNMTLVKFLGPTANLRRMEQAFEQLIERHESLRTSFEKIDGVAWQKVHPAFPFSFDRHECTPEAFEAWVTQYIQPFDLSRAPLFRSAVVHVTGLGYAWVVDMHHIISDGTSQQILADDFMKLYQGESLSPLTIQYKDFTYWQNDLIANGALATQVAYWQKTFADGIPRLDLAADRPRPSAFNFEGNTYPFTLGPALTARLQQFTQESRGTLQMVLLAILNTVLYKYTGQEDIVIGCGIAGRRHADVEEIVGMFVNSLAIRSYPESNKRFSDFYKEVADSCIAAYENQDVQFEDLLDKLNVERDASRNPVFDISLIVQNFDRSRAEKAALFAAAPDIDPGKLALIKYAPRTSKFDMDWFVEETGNDIHINLEYYAAIFNEQTIARLAGHFLNVLESVLDNPGIRLSHINLLTVAEAEELLTCYTSGEILPVAAGATVNSLFEQQAALHPVHTAVVSNSHTLTYNELDEQASQLARFLHDGIQVKAGARIGILQSRQAQWIISMMGILKSGAAYVPLDSEYPEDRLLFMIRDAGIEVLLTEKKYIELANSLQWRCSSLKHIVCMDSSAIYEERGLLKNDLMRKELWDHIGDVAEDNIGQGGWINSYTGENFTASEMEEYSVNAYLKLKDHLHKDMRVLEIGCSSGLTMFQIAPLVGFYYGTDLSSSILDKTREAVAEKNYTNIRLHCMPADQIDQVNEKDFDLVIINSVIQCFNGHNYLRDVISKAIAKMKDKGILFIGDIMDEDKREEMVADFIDFKKHRRKNGQHTKTDWGMELFVSRNFFNDLIADGTGITNGIYTNKIFTIANELTDFRYDAMLLVDKNGQPAEQVKTKYQYDLAAIRSYAARTVNYGVTGSHLACVIYTSGTTGLPKGVMIGHSALASRFAAEQALLNAGQHTITCTTTNMSFDVSLLETLFPLTIGGTIIVLSKDLLLSPRNLVNTIAAHKVTLLQGTPSFIKGIFLEALEGTPLPALTHIAIGGESLNGALVKELKQHLPHIVINNQYGPTEAVIDAIALKDVGEFRRNLIGRPIANTTVYILSEEVTLMPVGAIGEIVIGGSLALGYLGNEALTSERFAADPFRVGELVYKTGDLGRYLPDGNIEFIGRKDDQVKVRGYRIEPGEIGHAIQAYPGITSVFVTAKPDKHGENELIAYIAGKEQVNTTDLRAQISTLLPAYMLPNHFVQMDALPLTSNGKVNRKKLPDPDGMDLSAAVLYLAPRNPIEEKLVEIWQEILGLERVGVTDNFFEIGGHSLRVIRVLSKVRNEYKVDIKIEEVFNHPTIEYMAKAIARKQWMMEQQRSGEDEMITIAI